jgi:diguanylate cyclase (GGDEF)-like protein
MTRFFAATDKRHLVIVHEDITERKLAEEATAQQALHDSLTGLPNRRLLLDRLVQALSRVARDGDSLAVLCLDLDNFKEINDTFGHEAGDRVLVEVAKRLSNCLREMDTAARFGGDEFIVLLEQASGEKAAAIATRIIQALSEPFCVGETHTKLTSSIGIALSNLPYKRPDDLLRFADHAMYKSKQKGEGRYTLFEPAT